MSNTTDTPSFTIVACTECDFRWQGSAHDVVTEAGLAHISETMHNVRQVTGTSRLDAVDTLTGS